MLNVAVNSLAFKVLDLNINVWSDDFILSENVLHVMSDIRIYTVVVWAALA